MMRRDERLPYPPPSGSYRGIWVGISRTGSIWWALRSPFLWRLGLCNHLNIFVTYLLWLYISSRLREAAKKVFFSGPTKDLHPLPTPSLVSSFFQEIKKISFFADSLSEFQIEAPLPVCSSLTQSLTHECNCFFPYLGRHQFKNIELNVKKLNIYPCFDTSL